ncbi:MAG: hypothetical protein Q4D62_13255 [Planctomycetia bacterium]|nr:hypothetical protein [Planctomycetia bacterium]MDO4585059.1 hypothetical protein [Planctomycetia bacterium]
MSKVALGSRWIYTASLAREKNFFQSLSYSIFHLTILTRPTGKLRVC